MHQRQRPPITLVEFGQALQEEWNRLPLLTIDRITRSMSCPLTESHAVCLVN